MAKYETTFILYSDNVEATMHLFKILALNSKDSLLEKQG